MTNTPNTPNSRENEHRFNGNSSSFQRKTPVTPYHRPETNSAKPQSERRVPEVRPDDVSPSSVQSKVLAMAVFKNEHGVLSKEIVDVTSPRFVELVSRYQPQVLPAPDNARNFEGTIYETRKIRIKNGDNIEMHSLEYRVTEGAVRFVDFKPFRTHGFDVTSTRNGKHDMLTIIVPNEHLIINNDKQLKDFRTVLSMVSGVNRDVLKNDRVKAEETAKTTESETEDTEKKSETESGKRD